MAKVSGTTNVFADGKQVGKFPDTLKKFTQRIKDFNHDVLTDGWENGVREVEFDNGVSWEFQAGVIDEQNRKVKKQPITRDEGKEFLEFLSLATPVIAAFVPAIAPLLSIVGPIIRSSPPPRHSK